METSTAGVILVDGSQRRGVPGGSEAAAKRAHMFGWAKGSRLNFEKVDNG